MDLTQSIAVDSTQINADDLVSGPQTFTIKEVKPGRAEQPFDFMLVETDRAYRPNKTMRRLIVIAWGPESSTYAGKRLTLYREPSIRFGSAVTGGIRISAMSGITKTLKEKLQTTRGKREEFVVEPLPDVAPAPKRPTAPSHMDRLADAFRAAGIADVLWLDYCTNVLLRPVNAPTDLSPEDADKVVAALEADAQGEDGGAS